MNTEIENIIEVENENYESDEHFEYIENELKSIYIQKNQNNEITEDECILNFVILGERVYNLSREQKYALLKYLEEYYESESNNELGDFINDLMFTYITINDVNHLHIYIAELINNCELNLEVIHTVYECIINIFN